VNRFTLSIAAAATALSFASQAFAGDQYIDGTGFAASGYDVVAYFDLPQNPRLIESLYLNHHYPQPGARSRPVFQYRKRVRNSFQPRNVPILNVGQFNEAVRSSLVARIPGILDAVKELENG